MKIQQNFENVAKSAQNFARLKKIQFENLVDLEKCCKTRIFLQKSMPIQPKTSDILPKFCQNLATTPRLLDLVPDGAASRDDVLEEPDRTVSFVQEEQAHEEQLRSRSGSGSSSSGGGTPAEDSAGVPPEGSADSLSSDSDLVGLARLFVSPF